MEVDQLDDLNDLNLNGQFAAELKEMNLTHLNTFTEIEGITRNQSKIETVKESNNDKIQDNNINNIKNVTAQIYKLDGNIQNEIRDKENKILTNKDKDKVNIKDNESKNLKNEKESDELKLNDPKNNTTSNTTIHYNNNFKNSI